MEWRGKITSDTKVMLGKPVIAGTRLTVELVLDRLAAGESREQLIEQFPRLTDEGITAALAFAAETMKTTVVRSGEEVMV